MESFTFMAWMSSIITGNLLSIVLLKRYENSINTKQMKYFAEIKTQLE